MALDAGMLFRSAFEVFDSAKDGRVEAIEVFRKMGYYLGIGISSLINVLNPEMIVIGGGVSAAWELFSGPVADEIRVRSFREPADRAKIVRAELGDDAGIMGAARSAFELLA
jgi:glucokinase